MPKKIKRNKVDICNICLQRKELTWDHVPPKGGITLSTVEIEGIYKVLSNSTKVEKLISQNGVKYRTICRDCNSMLGSEFDRELNAFNIAVATYLRSSLILPPFTYVKTKPVKLIKALLGHILSAKETIDETVFDNNVRAYLFDDNAILPDNIHILYWIYPYDCFVIQRDFVMPAVRGNMSSHIFCNLIKYFPIAFLICDNSSYHELPSLTKYRNLSINEDVEVRIDLRRIEEFDWPEKVDESNIIAASKETMNGILAKPRNASR